VAWALVVVVVVVVQEVAFYQPDGVATAWGVYSPLVRAARQVTKKSGDEIIARYLSSYGQLAVCFVDPAATSGLNSTLSSGGGEASHPNYPCHPTRSTLPGALPDPQLDVERSLALWAWEAALPKALSQRSAANSSYLSISAAYVSATISSVP
jgi:hypothetical protein